MSTYKVVPIDPNAVIEVEKISDIPSWIGDIASLQKHNQPLEEQRDRETRDSVKKYILPDQRYVHYYDFGPKLIKRMSKIKRGVKSSNIDADPVFTQHPAWRSYITIYTSEERSQLAYADRQREHKKVIALELEEIIPANPHSLLDKLKEIKQIRRRNLWLLKMVNELGEIEIIATSDKQPYLQTLELIS